MNVEKIHTRLNEIEAKRDVLVRLLEKPDLGVLRLDVDQALEELDELLEEFVTAFPERPKM